MVGQGGELQRLHGLPVLEKPLLFLQGLLLPGLQGLGPLHHLGGLVAHEALVIGAGFGRLHPVGPDGGPPGGLLEPPHVLPEALVFGLFELLRPVEVLLPGAVVSRLNLNVRPVQGQDVVHAAVQETAVMGHQDKAPLPPEVS